MKKQPFRGRNDFLVEKVSNNFFLFSLFRFHAHSDTSRLYIALFMYKCFSTNSVNFICARTLCFKLRFASFFCFFLLFGVAFIARSSDRPRGGLLGSPGENDLLKSEEACVCSKDSSRRSSNRKKNNRSNKQECPWYKPATKKATSNTPQKSPE